MKVITRHGMAVEAVARAKSWTGREFPWVIALRAIPDNEVTADRVESAIGHRGQTTALCHECNSHDEPVLVEVGEEPDYESSTASVCLTCLRRALALAEAAP